jgi:protoporphyrin/coproporphyrin ferrochelatase
VEQHSAGMLRMIRATIAFWPAHVAEISRPAYVDFPRQRRSDGTLSFSRASSRWPGGAPYRNAPPKIPPPAMADPMRVGVLLLNFGEPEEPSIDSVVPFLERIFALNAPLRGSAGPAEVRERSRRLAEERAPGLIAEYEEIGGSPLQRQAREQAEALQRELVIRGLDAYVALGMQFTEPSIGAAVRAARDAGADTIVGLPVYPLCGPSTTVAALRDLDRELTQCGWEVPVRQISGWHRHPGYVRLRADAIRDVLEEYGLSFGDPGTRLVFSAHGTPISYLEQGSRYDDYVHEFCASLAAELGVDEYLIGYQNHSDRPGIAWTEPEIDTVIAEIEAERVVVDPVSFMHEQSETLAELDHELRSLAESRGLGFHRVPIPHAAPEFISVLADLVEEAMVSATPPRSAHTDQPALLGPCRCKDGPGVLCTNGED